MENVSDDELGYHDDFEEAIPSTEISKNIKKDDFSTKIIEKYASPKSPATGPRTPRTKDSVRREFTNSKEKNPNRIIGFEYPSSHLTSDSARSIKSEQNKDEPSIRMSGNVIHQKDI